MTRQSSQTTEPPALVVLAGDPTPAQVAQVFDTSSTRSSQRPLSYLTLRKFRWTVAAFEWKLDGSESAWQQSSSALSSATDNKISFGSIGDQQGQNYFAAPGVYSVRLCLGQACFTNKLDNLQVCDSQSRNLTGAIQTIRGEAFKVRVTEPKLSDADSFTIKNPPREIRSGVPTKLHLLFHRRQRYVMPSASELQTARIICQPELVR